MSDGNGFQIFSLLFQCGMPLFLIALGWGVGRTVEAAHLRRLDRLEADLLTIPITNLKRPPTGVDGAGGMLVVGAVVIASDYFKTFVASLRKLIGGEVRSYERLMLRARREAVCRMMHDARKMGATAVINVRYETSSIGRMSRNPSPMVEVIAYGTAVLPGPPAT